MKNVLIALLLLLTVAACSTKKDPEPDLAGTYQMSRFIDTSRSFDFQLPGVVNGKNVSGIVLVTRTSDTQITWRVDLTIDGQVSQLNPVPSDIRKASGREYDVLEGGVRIGTINGTDFLIDITDNNIRQALTARK